MIAQRMVKWFLGIYQIIGGGIGLYYLISGISKDTTLSQVILKLMFTIGLIILAFVSGYQLLVLERWKWTVLNQFLQVIQIKIGGFAFYLISGTYVGFGYIFERRGFIDFSVFESIVFVRFNQPGGASVLSLNLVSLVLFGLACIMHSKYLHSIEKN